MLPPPFLLPAWTPRQLAQLVQQARTHKLTGAGGRALHASQQREASGPRIRRIKLKDKPAVEANAANAHDECLEQATTSGIRIRQFPSSKREVTARDFLRLEYIKKQRGEEAAEEEAAILKRLIRLPRSQRHAHSAREYQEQVRQAQPHGSSGLKPETTTSPGREQIHQRREEDFAEGASETRWNTRTPGSWGARPWMEALREELGKPLAPDTTIPTEIFQQQSEGGQPEGTSKAAAGAPEPSKSPIIDYLSAHARPQPVGAFLKEQRAHNLLKERCVDTQDGVVEQLLRQKNPSKTQQRRLKWIEETTQRKDAQRAKLNILDATRSEPETMEALDSSIGEPGKDNFTEEIQKAVVGEFKKSYQPTQEKQQEEPIEDVPEVVAERPKKRKKPGQKARRARRKQMEEMLEGGEMSKEVDTIQAPAPGESEDNSTRELNSNTTATEIFTASQTGRHLPIPEAGKAISVLSKVRQKWKALWGASTAPIFSDSAETTPPDSAWNENQVSEVVKPECPEFVGSGKDLDQGPKNLIEEKIQAVPAKFKEKFQEELKGKIRKEVGKSLKPGPSSSQIFEQVEKLPPSRSSISKDVAALHAHVDQPSKGSPSSLPSKPSETTKPMPLKLQREPDQKSGNQVEKPSKPASSESQIFEKLNSAYRSRKPVEFTDALSPQPQERIAQDPGNRTQGLSKPVSFRFQGSHKHIAPYEMWEPRETSDSTTPNSPQNLSPDPSPNPSSPKQPQKDSRFGYFKPDVPFIVWKPPTVNESESRTKKAGQRVGQQKEENSESKPTSVDVRQHAPAEIKKPAPDRPQEELSQGHLRPASMSGHEPPPAGKEEPTPPLAQDQLRLEPKKTIPHPPSATFQPLKLSGSQKQRVPKTEEPPSEEPRQVLSLFDELFPEESEAQKKKKKKAEERLDKLPAFEFNPPRYGQFLRKTESNVRANLRRQEKLQLKSRRDPTQPSPKISDMSELVLEEKPRQDLTASTKSILVLRACHSTLEESDFFRLGPRGEHIEGWTGGILKVIPSRDNNTLETHGVYFILFSSDAAAKAYYDHIRRFHILSRSRSTRGPSILPPPPAYLREGEDIEELLRGFSLVPAHDKLSLRAINKPFRSSISKLISEGGVAQIASRKSKAEDLVLFNLDYGHISKYDLESAIADDGRRRNLHWELARGQKGDDNIVQLNHETVIEKGDTEDGGRRKTNAYDKPSRFVISFGNKHEARRFVREWHRRPFITKAQYVQRREDEPPPLVSAKILW